METFVVCFKTSPQLLHLFICDAGLLQSSRKSFVDYKTSPFLSEHCLTNFFYYYYYYFWMNVSFLINCFRTCGVAAIPAVRTLSPFSKVQTNNEIILIVGHFFQSLPDRADVSACVELHRDRQTPCVCVCVCVCVCGSVDQAEARPVMPYQRKYSRPYHTWLGCPHWPFYLSHMSWIPDLITRLLPSPLYCFIAILLSRDHVRYLQAPAQ